MKTTTQLSTLIILGMILVSCGPSQSAEAQSEVEAPKKAIHEATFFGDLEGVKQHIAYGTDLNQKDEFGSTPLSVSITFGKSDIAAALIEAGADLSITGPDGSTPLHSAAFFGRVQVVKLLLAKGVDMQATNSYGGTALSNASTPFDQMKPIYDQVSRDLGPFGFKIDYHELQKNREAITEIMEASLTNQGN